MKRWKGSAGEGIRGSLLNRSVETALCANLPHSLRAQGARLFFLVTLKHLVTPVLGFFFVIHVLLLLIEE